jgi:SpoIID/LytB domain protein
MSPRRRIAHRPLGWLAVVSFSIVALVAPTPGGTLATDRAQPSLPPPPSADPPPIPDGARRGVVPTPSPTATPSPVATPVPTPVPTPTPAGPTMLGPTITFHGRGYGHGVGMSQHGARGRALAGQSAAEILAHYYQGTSQGSISLDTPIRVRVLDDFAATSTNPLVVVGRRSAWSIDGVAATFPRDARIEVRGTASKATSGPAYVWRARVVTAGGSIVYDARITTFRLRGADASTVLRVASRTSDHDTYRGALRVGLNGSTGRASVTNELAIEHYLRGVVPAEMPASWPQAALEAQSIAARSFAARRLRPGTSYFDVVDDTSAQLYLGVLGERPETTAAIDATAGIVLRSGSSIANAMFHSAGGGATEHNENVYVSAAGERVATPVSYLRGSRDRRPDGSAYDDGSPYATWRTATYSRSQLSAWFGADGRTNVGALTALDLRARGVSGRLIRVTLIGSHGTKTVSGDVFRAIFNARRPAGDPMLRSTLFDTRSIP